MSGRPLPQSRPDDPRTDTHLAHGYAHQIAHRDAQGHPGVRGVVRAVLLCGAGLGWWRSAGIEYVAFGINTVK
ncbi:hypothetical protein ABZ614_23915 [Streptomyces sp. NPDC013178]|uniref:hypothetical protein n=1 Tax=Streptomyces sp. NPDC013178 TaxID=3155118 RepID=UPI003404291B